MPLSETIHGVVHTSEGREIELHSRVGEGGEGSVFHVGGHADQVAKLYNDKMDAKERAEKAEKLRLLVDLNNEKLKIAAAWPLELILDANGSIIGFTMEYLSGYQPLFMAYQIKTRLKKLQGRDYGFLVRIASNLSACVHYVHEAGLVIGDINESNVLVTAGAMVKLIDADSFQVKTASGYLTPGVGKTELLPPELQGKSLDDRVRTPEEDQFSLAVLIFQTLVFGRHPFAGRPKGGADVTLETAIENGWYVFADDKNCPLAPPPNMDMSFLSPKIRDMFKDAFLPGRKRPTAEEWHLALRDFELELKPCRKTDAHLHWQGCESCPWCALEASMRVALFSPKRVSKRQWEDVDFDALEAAIDNVQPPILEPALPEPKSYLVSPISLPWWERMLAFGTFRNLSFVYIFASIQLVKAVSSMPGMQGWIMSLIITALALFCGLGIFRPALLRYKMRHLSKQYESLNEQWTRSASLELFEAKKDEYRGIVKELRSLETKREELRLTSLRLKYGHHLDSYLSRYSIAIADVPIGARETLDTLIDRGIRTAADVSRPVIQNVLGKNSPLLDDLTMWVAELEMQFWRSSSHPLDEADEERIEEQVYQIRQELLAKLKTVEHSLSSFGAQLQRNQSTLLREYESFAGDYAIQRSRLEHYSPAAKEDDKQSLNA